MLNKSEVVQAILESLTSEFENLVATSKKTRSAGNDAQTRAEGKYDTRSTEENYLADGQALQAQAVRLSIDAIASLPLRPTNAPIGVGSLVQVAFRAETMWFFLSPAAGGLEITLGSDEITVITLDSPLGAQLRDQTVGKSIARPPGKVVALL